ncbi:hypothetical protein BpHYR1_007028 [Brachionus plicatilis]|uniref:Beta-catenin-interacting ICAT domain-containing protein n=1 Tax=Brachionus plicatilis TaxID=10195 RepID=A0A3M7RZ06_BRAPC|nr:hypothetical protein BpHYR1_007028 [Brachionus plicatilis]
MASRGKTETEILEKNLYSQLDRLIDQLKDIEESKDDMSDEEYTEQKQETLEQLKELNASVAKFKEGNLSLVDQMNAIQLAIQAAVSNAFQTPEVIQMFAKKEKPQLHQRLADLDERIKLGQVADMKSALRQKLEILYALQKLGEKLTDDQNHFLVSNSNTTMKEFEIASINISTGLLNVAGNQIQEAKN